ncbi:MAG: VOC family protein [Candidatus Dormibacteria bacterium]
MINQTETDRPGLERHRGSAWPLGRVNLKVLDLDAQVAFYRRFGLTVTSTSSTSVMLGAGEREILELTLLQGGKPRPGGTAGLYHFAILVPDEPTLGSFVRHAAEARLPFIGASDHLVSQALYFEDPEGNQIEVYADRPRSEWSFRNGRVDMATLPLDLDRIAALAAVAWAGFPDGTVIGHMHLNVADLDRSQAFYQELGMAVTADIGGFMRFMSWDGYHHHLGLNLGQGRGAAPVDPGVSGLASYTASHEGVAAIESIDPDGIRVVRAG